MVVKAFRALVTKELVIGSGIANKSVLIALTKKFPKMLIGISEQQLTENKDAMNYQIAEKVCSERITEKLTRPEEQGTKSFPLLMRHIITAYIEPSTEPSNRLFSAWYVAFFCRLWKSHLMDSPADAFKESMKPTIDRNFISSNLHVCMEINGHHTTVLHNRCREMNRPELFLVSLTGSQPCEDKFRTYRSMSTTRSTVINFDVKEMLQKSKRLRMLDTIASTTDDFTFTAKKQKNIFIRKFC